MNKQALSYIKVGGAFVLLFGLLVSTFIFLRGFLNSDQHFSVLYDDAKGLKRGEIIQMAGVDIGTVDAVGLMPSGKRALVRVGVNKQYQIPFGSRFIIKSGVLGNSRVLVIEPNTDPTETRKLPDGATLEGTSVGGIDTALAQSEQLIKQSQKLVSSLTDTANAFNKLANDPETQKSLKASLRNVEETTANLPVLQRQIQSELSTLSLQANSLLAGLQTTKRSADKIAVNADGLTTDLRATLNENRGNLRALLRDTDDAVSGLAGLTEQVNATLGDKKLQNNLQAATDNLVSVSSRLDATVADLQRITGDPRLSSDIRTTVSNLKDTSESVKNLTARVEAIRFPGEKRQPRPGETPAPPKPPVPFAYTSLLEPGLVFDGVYDTKERRLGASINYTYLSGPQSFYRIGITDFTDGDRFNLQAGSYKGVPAKFDYRYGIIQGKLGAGLDFRGGPLDFRLDAFDPNRLTVNGRVKAYVNKNFAITGGVDALGKGNRPAIGLQYRLQK